MQIQFLYDPSVAAAPGGFTAALNAAASYLDALITNPITVTIEVGWGENAGIPIPSQDVATGAPGIASYPYADVRSALAASAASPGQTAAADSLPPADPLPGSTLYVPVAEAQALGLPVDAGLAGSVGFGSGVGFDFDPSNPAAPGVYDFIAVAEHEITHALGRYSGIPPGGPAAGFTPFDLFRYAAPGVHATSGNMPAYFSTDSGATDLAPFDTTSDPADWADSVQGDAFSAVAEPGEADQVTPVDMTALNALGFQVNGSIQQSDVYSGTYAAAAPEGATITLQGTGQVTLSAAGNTVNVLAGADTIFAAPDSAADRVNNTGGSVFFQAAPSTGETADLFNGAGPVTVAGAANNFIVDQNTGPAAGAVMMAGGGNETLYDASPGNDQYWGGFGGGDDLIFAGGGSDMVVAGNGADTLVGGSGNDIFYIINSQLLGALTHGPAHPGQDLIFNAHQGDVLALTGFDSLYGAAGSGLAAQAADASLAKSGAAVLADGTTISFAGGTGGMTIISS